MAAKSHQDIAQLTRTLDVVAYFDRKIKRRHLRPSRDVAHAVDRVRALLETVAAEHRDGAIEMKQSAIAAAVDALKQLKSAGEANSVSFDTVMRTHLVMAIAYLKEEGTSEAWL